MSYDDEPRRTISGVSCKRRIDHWPTNPQREGTMPSSTADPNAAAHAALFSKIAKQHGTDKAAAIVARIQQAERAGAIRWCRSSFVVSVGPFAFQ